MKLLIGSSLSSLYNIEDTSIRSKVERGFLVASSESTTNIVNGVDLAISFDARFKPSSFSGRQIIMAKGDLNAFGLSSSGWAITVEGTSVEFWIGMSRKISFNISRNDVWNTYTFVIDRSSGLAVTVYKDSEIQDTWNDSSDFSSTTIVSGFSILGAFSEITGEPLGLQSKIVMDNLAVWSGNFNTSEVLNRSFKTADIYFDFNNGVVGDFLNSLEGRVNSVSTPTITLTEAVINPFGAAPITEDIIYDVGRDSIIPRVSTVPVPPGFLDTGLLPFSGESDPVNFSSHRFLFDAYPAQRWSVSNFSDLVHYNFTCAACNIDIDTIAILNFFSGRDYNTGYDKNKKVFIKLYTQENFQGDPFVVGSRLAYFSNGTGFGESPFNEGSFGDFHPFFYPANLRAVVDNSFVLKNDVIKHIQGTLNVRSFEVQLINLDSSPADNLQKILIGKSFQPEHFVINEFQIKDTSTSSLIPFTNQPRKVLKKAGVRVLDFSMIELTEEQKEYFLQTYKTHGKSLGAYVDLYPLSNKPEDQMYKFYGNIINDPEITRTSPERYSIKMQIAEV